MNYGRKPRRTDARPRLALLCLLALAPLATGAQGFGSVSSQPAPVVPSAVTVPFGSGEPAVPLASPPAVAAGQPATALPITVGQQSGAAPAPEMPVASAQIAALGFSSVSGMSGTDAQQSAAGQPGAAGSNRPYEMADKVIVYKGDRTLQLLRGGRVIAEYPIKLGLNPYGHKRQEGDFRTPEGRYTLVRRNPQSEFFLSIQVSYPNQEDVAVARERGLSPGGLIMIHGQPNEPKKPPEWYATRDWTDGCIALSNANMSDVWLRTPLGTPIEIRP